MIELMPDMPAGVTGIRVAGRLRGEDLREFKPTMDDLVKSGEIRIVEVIEPDYEGFGPGGLVEDLKPGSRCTDSASFGVQANCGGFRQGLGGSCAACVRLDGPWRARAVRSRRGRAGQGVGGRLT